MPDARTCHVIPHTVVANFALFARCLLSLFSVFMHVYYTVVEKAGPVFLHFQIISNKFGTTSVIFDTTNDYARCIKNRSLPSPSSWEASAP